MASDQTPELYRTMGLADQLGTGVFLLRGASGETIVSFRASLTYAEARQRGEGFVAFKWIPLEVASYAAVESSRCPLVGEPCSATCDAHGCLCDQQAGHCVDSSANSGSSSGQSGSGFLSYAPKGILEPA